MQFLKDEEYDGAHQLLPPVSPNGLYLNSSALSLAILGVLEMEDPIQYFPQSQLVCLLQTLLLPIHPRFSSVIVTGKDGGKGWKKVEVNLTDHTKTPVFAEGKSPEFYEECFDNYLSEISAQEFGEGRPLWEIHLVKYPTTNAAGHVIFKIHHAIGDGYSLMAALLSCFKRSDDPSLPLTFPNNRIRRSSSEDGGRAAFLSKALTSVLNTASDLWFSFSKTRFSEDDLSPIRSADPAVGSRPISVATMTFSLEDVKKIKDHLGMTINDVIAGAIFLGVRLYMQERDPGSEDAETTALVLMNTRMLGGYNSIQEMVKPKTTSPWGNHFAFLHVAVPKLTATSNNDDDDDQLIRMHHRAVEFVRSAAVVIQKKRFSVANPLTAKLLDLYRKLKGPELKSTSMGIISMIGPLEKMTIADHHIKGMYVMVAGSPQDVNVAIVSYMGHVRISIGAEKDFIDLNKLKSCIQMAFQDLDSGAKP